jgi:succinyl-CoA synthetase beta subunit
VVRLQGTNAEAARKILADSSPDIATAETLLDAGEQVVRLARGEGA